MMRKPKTTLSRIAHTVIHTTDENGEPIARVPLARGRQGWATLYEEDLRLLETLGLSMCWFTLAKGHVAASAYKAKGKLLLVARVLLDAPAGQNVGYVNGDKSDLRRDNLKLSTHGRKSSQRARESITPFAEKTNNSKETKHEYL